MIKKIIKNLTPLYSNLSQLKVFTIYFLATLFIRFPFFFRDYIDRDESTFILMGQSWADGFLPYTQLWDLKPPITFLFFASIIYTFGKSFFAIRFFGVVIVAATAFFSYKTGALHTKKTGFWAGVLTLILLSLFGSLQGVMSEHICMFFCMPALYLLIKYDSYKSYFISGLLLGLAVLSKLNIAYLILILSFYLIIENTLKYTFTKAIGLSLVLGLGILLIILATVAPYYAVGNPEIWWDSVVVASLDYTNEKHGSLGKILRFCGVLALFLAFIWKQKYIDLNLRFQRVLMVTTIAIGITFFLGGKLNGHYLIQFHPIFTVIFVLALSKMSFLKNAIVPYFSLLLLLVPAESYKEYFDIIKHKINRGSFYNGEGITAPNYIIEKGLQDKSVLFFEYHIGYWVLGKLPPTKAATHPSNMLRSAIFPILNNPRKTGFEELQFIIETKRPEIIVTRSGRTVFDHVRPMENLYVHTYLAMHYKLLKRVDNADIYVRRGE